MSLDTVGFKKDYIMVYLLITLTMFALQPQVLQHMTYTAGFL